MCGPVRRRSEHPSTSTIRRITTKLMIHRCHRVLRNSPRVIRLHRYRRRYNQRGRLPRSHPVITAMPRSLIRLRPRPVISPRRMPYPSSIRSKPVRIRTTCGQVTVVEHVPLNRSANRMHRRTNMRNSTMNMRSRPVNYRSMRMPRCHLPITALIARLLPLSTRTGKQHCKSSTSTHKSSNHKGLAKNVFKPQLLFIPEKRSNTLSDTRDPTLALLS